MKATVQIFAENAQEIDLLFKILANPQLPTSVDVTGMAEVVETQPPVMPATPEIEQALANLGPKLVKDEPTPVPAEPVTLKDVKNALQAFAKSKGMPAAQELLQTFGAQRASGLKEEQYADVLAKMAALA